MHNLLLDTGALVALIDRSDRNSARCVEFFKSFRGNIYTTEPVLTESLYLLGPSLKAQKACIDFILRKGAALVPQSAQSLSRAIELMETYGDVPMDFSDAPLVTLAEETETEAVFTLDKKGFYIYRLHGRKAFTVLP